jgi:hypothetical protein
MLNIFHIGLEAQRQTVQANQANTYMRQVGDDELLAEVQREAIEHHCFVWVNSKQDKTLICRNQPIGEGWNKCQPFQTRGQH